MGRDIKKFYIGDWKKCKFKYDHKETKALRKLFEGGRNISEDNLRRVVLWKLNRSIHIPNDLLQKLVNLAKKDKVDPHGREVNQLIRALISCKGIGLPMASTILKFLRPDIFPIIDVRAYRAIFGKKPYFSQYSVELYLKYLTEIYKIRDELDLPLHAVDEQLYEFDKEHNGKI